MKQLGKGLKVGPHREVSSFIVASFFVFSFVGGFFSLFFVWLVALVCFFCSVQDLINAYY